VPVLVSLIYWLMVTKESAASSLALMMQMSGGPGVSEIAAVAQSFTVPAGGVSLDG
jgi:hypothetical protein